MNQLNSKLAQVGDRYPYTPEEAALLMRRRVYIRLKWVAIAGVIVATLIASQLFGISFPVVPVYIIAGTMALNNLLLLLQMTGLADYKAGEIGHRVRLYGYIDIVSDLVALTVLLHFTGGIENPFLFYFVFHIIIASIVQHYRSVYLLATLALALVVGLVSLEYFGVIPHVNLAGFAPPTLYREGSYILANLTALGTILFATTYMVTAISAELRKRQREVLQLRESLLAEKTQELAKLEEEKRRFLLFLGTAAHDLKAPLTAIQGFLWVMLRGLAGAVTEKQKDMLERSSRRIGELMKLISDLLDIPRIETGQIVQEIKNVALGELVHQTCEDLSAQARQKGLSLKMEIPEHLSPVPGSTPRLQQVITNLVGNAIKYTGEGGVTVRLTEGKGELRCELMDTGIGIPPQDLPQIFNDFFRASNVEDKGTGLGLSITKRIVEAHGGKIWVESPSPETGQGTKFTFCLPKK